MTKTPNDIDLTPPRDTPRILERWLIRNFDILKAIFVQRTGVTDTFITNDSTPRLATVEEGIIVSFGSTDPGEWDFSDADNSHHLLTAGF